eukprot:15367129-Ditylum_brightwellii.AAC.2
MLQNYQYDLESYINSQPNMMVLYGLEFWPVMDLDLLLSHHPNCTLLRHNITHRIDCPLTPIEDKKRVVCLHQAFKQGNHKSARGPANKDILVNLMPDDIDLVYGIPLPIKILSKIPFAEIYPLGVQHQQSINKMGNVITKDRVSHNLSFPKDTLALNNRVITDLLKPCHNGHLLTPPWKLMPSC